MPEKLSASEFVKAWNDCGGSPLRVSQHTGISLRNVYARRKSLERMHGMTLATAEITGRTTPYSPPAHFVRRRTVEVADGVVVVFSDAHLAPDHSPIGFTALAKVIKALKPQLIVANGDLVDGDTVSRFDPTRGHHKRFTLREELDCVREHLADIQKVAGKAQLSWTLGNHDLRVSRFVATRAPELLDMPYTRLEDWFPAWWLSWTVEVNPGTPSMTVIRHRPEAGMLHLQAAKAGTHRVSGHLHKLNVHRNPGYNGVRYSVDTGSIADSDSNVFDYAEGAPPHAQGFCVLTYKAGKLLPPELVEVVDGVAYFRGTAVV